MHINEWTRHVILINDSKTQLTPWVKKEIKTLNEQKNTCMHEWLHRMMTDFSTLPHRHRSWTITHITHLLQMVVRMKSQWNNNDSQWFTMIHVHTHTHTTIAFSFIHTGFLGFINHIHHHTKILLSSLILIVVHRIWIICITHTYLIFSLSTTSGWSRTWITSSLQRTSVRRPCLSKHTTVDSPIDRSPSLQATKHWVKQDSNYLFSVEILHRMWRYHHLCSGSSCFINLSNHFSIHSLIVCSSFVAWSWHHLI